MVISTEDIKTAKGNDAVVIHQWGKAMGKNNTQVDILIGAVKTSRQELQKEKESLLERIEEIDFILGIVDARKAQEISEA